jgi:hypothetical protein
VKKSGELKNRSIPDLVSPGVLKVANGEPLRKERDALVLDMME